LEGWQKHFNVLLIPVTGKINNRNIHEGPINNLELEEPTYDEINEIIKKILISIKLPDPMKYYPNLYKKWRSHFKT
jgi:hypothetical protein